MVAAERHVPLQRCVARPPDGSRTYPLLEHLWNVARSAGDPAGSPAEQLLFLAGLLHDVGKARRTWQERLLDAERRGATGPHAFVGAAIFAALAFRWLQPRSDRAELEPLVLWTCRDIADHHGPLRDLELDPPWGELWSPGVLDDLDVDGLLGVLRQTKLSLAGNCWPGSRPELTRWVEEARRHWGRAVIRLGHGHTGPVSPTRLLRHRTAKLIAADRYDVANLEEDWLNRGQAEQAIGHMEKFLAAQQEAGAGGIAAERQRIQAEVLKQYRENPRQPVYTLVLPTGSGKTLTALRVALEACRLNGRRRIVYAGPYLSVVEQAAQQIARVTGLPVVQHHHLALSSSSEQGSDRLSDGERDLLVLESWQAPVMAVTFNQLFRALFPARAQHTVRIPALFGSFVIVDEPQIVHETGWSLFTQAMAAATQAWDLQVLIMTATMPPWNAEGVTPADLSVPVNLPSRYTLRVLEQPLTASELAERLVGDAADGLPVAAILNTIADAAGVLSAVKRLVNAGDIDDRVQRFDTAHRRPDWCSIPVIGVHGYMTPIHKRLHIRRIREAVDGERPVVVVATQALEAGVDLDFARLYRARPILPSVLQAAGRVNRHGLRATGEVLVFDFMGASGDSRRWVYRDGIARDETDRLLKPGGQWDERGFEALVPSYFAAVSQRRPGSDTSGPLAEAVRGKWSVLGGLAPFEEGPPRIPVFVPHDAWLGHGVLADLRYWGCETLEELFQLYLRPGWVPSLSHRDRRRFLGLLEQFVVPVRWEVARRVADTRVTRAILPLVDREAYTEDNGFGDLRGDSEPDLDIW